MNDGIVTECPECETRFNVSNGQLKLADGKVRCGACLRVFDARAQQPYSQDSLEADSSARQRAPEREYSLHVRHAGTPQTGALPVPGATARAPDTAEQSFDPDAPLEVSSPPHTTDQDSAQAHRLDTAPGKAAGPIPIAHLLRNPAEQPGQEPVQPADPQPVQPQAEPPAGTGFNEAPSHEQADTVADDHASTATPANHHNAAAQDAAQTTKPETATQAPPAVLTPGTGQAQTMPDSAPSAAPAWPPTSPVMAPHTEAPQPQGLDALQNLHAEPLELTPPPTPAPAGAILGWSLGCLAAGVLLASQLAWFNRIEWSRQPVLTEAYNILCNQVECAIPPRQAVELIRNRQLVVRAHPRFEDALSIDLLLENTADFRQPFPAIELSFSDIRGRTVARRILQPQEYLDDTLDPLKMAHSQPFQVNLAILDPGRRAVSYEVQLAPARL